MSVANIATAIRAFLRAGYPETAPTTGYSRCWPSGRPRRPPTGVRRDHIVIHITVCDHWAGGYKAASEKRRPEGNRHG